MDALNHTSIVVVGVCHDDDVTVPRVHIVQPVLHVQVKERALYILPMLRAHHPILIAVHV
jgi:hypothetical protein